MTDGMQTVLATTLAEKARIEAQIVALQEQVAALDEVAHGIRAYMDARRQPAVPDLVLGSGPEPRGKEAVRRVMAERPHAIWTAAQVKDAVVERGWIESTNRVLEAVRTNITRAMTTWPENIVQVGRGQYMFVPENAETPDHSGASDHLHEDQGGGDHDGASVVSLHR
jgi:hypothetical protein